MSIIWTYFKFIKINIIFDFNFLWINKKQFRKFIFNNLIILSYVFVKGLENYIFLIKIVLDNIYFYIITFSLIRSYKLYFLKLVFELIGNRKFKYSNLNILYIKLLMYTIKAYYVFKMNTIVRNVILLR